MKTKVYNFIKKNKNCSINDIYTELKDELSYADICRAVGGLLDEKAIKSTYKYEGENPYLYEVIE